MSNVYKYDYILYYYETRDIKNEKNIYNNLHATW